MDWCLQEQNKLECMEMEFHRGMREVTRLDRVRNREVKCRVVARGRMSDIMDGSFSKWFELVKRFGEKHRTRKLQEPNNEV